MKLNINLPRSRRKIERLNSHSFICTTIISGYTKSLVDTVQSCKYTHRTWNGLFITWLLTLFVLLLALLLALLSEILLCLVIY